MKNEVNLSRKRKKHGKIVLLPKYKLNTIEDFNRFSC